LTNLVAVPVREGRHRFGWIVSVNMADGKEFGTVEANLLNTVATILGTHVRNIDLLREQNDLLVGFVRSLVSTLDAKDPYTRGHSERVALIARRIGKEMRLPEEELKTIHLAGLLHDIGKIGVDDRILRKDGPLTDEEFDQVKKHPMIGYNILSGLKNLRHVLPGVRHHHENFDGSGYPDRLAGEDIPMLARVLAVADGYDAMGSDRPYRKGMPAERIDDVFRRGADRQWDPRVLDAYFRCRDDVRLLCAAHTLENGCPIGGVPQGAAML
ncbi:MAG TPA: HD-GYP domain-containing protein, partial [Planctomycetaceae bacterium]